MFVLLYVIVGCALGGSLRHSISAWCTHRWPGEFPWGTLTVNLLGSLGLGLLAGSLFSLEGPRLEAWPLFLIGGFFGGLTTFSSMALQTFLLWKKNQYSLAVVNSLANTVLPLALAWGGFMVGGFFHG
ncbi:MAG: fluoride efflux transporter CrcB [Opitutales bacterium]|nr:fluoride efflux transporter CrcB [Opitutales bacterium]MCH8541217.1 fluoride efflux transporter CrcB [Opitutales bacterium]